jgi:hypothetical protein
VARPFGSLDAVQQVRTEVGLLTLEVELLTDRLADREAAPRRPSRAPRPGSPRSVRRLDEIRGEL